MSTAIEARETVETAARESYGRLISYLSARCGDVALAEDALSDAFVAALTSWPERGVPARPEAWLLTAARNRLIDHARHAHVRSEHAAAALAAAADAAEAAAAGPDAFPDERLKLLFICADPAIDAHARTPLMLQTVLGLDAARIASAFLVSPAAMSQRLVRAKAKIREARLPFEVPPAAALGARVNAVAEAIYAAYASAWEDPTGMDPRNAGLDEEAVWLARLLVQLLPDEPEGRGLLALLQHCHARRGARRSPAGDFVPISEQDPALWDRELSAEAERQLTAASRHGRLGRFQLEAAIQSVHAARLHAGRTEWPAITVLYEGLVRLAPTLGALVGRAAAAGEVHGAAAGLALLDQLGERDIRTYQPYWAVRAHLLAGAGRPGEARDAYGRAIELASDDAVRRFLSAKRSALP